MKRLFFCLLLVPLGLSAQVTTYIDDVEILDGEVQDFVGDILETDPTPGVIIRSGGDSIFWANTKIILKPGFEAESGSLFWASIDTDGDGFSDIEEATDTDGDGIFDAYEYLYGMDPNDSNDAALDFDGDGITNLAEFQSGKDVWANDALDWFDDALSSIGLPQGEDVLIIDSDGDAFTASKTNMQLTPAN